jgi:hypothetical protein
VLEAKREEFVRLFREFARMYPQTPDGPAQLRAFLDPTRRAGEFGKVPRAP